ncbi:ATP-dependent RecD-like DNA helicase [Anaerotruncus rubiinfantis]|uniref:SF1B family DNA helicase RecD2 n=1 Tax=Anaerotruncus rubiinfantis TaxID=1720200 RepID=UPI001898DD67|nr:ATP-dependent RecD-like DNA helicase [Anaerotruncus rubiinfantis]
MQSGELYRLEGSVEAVIYHNPDNGYSVLEIATDEDTVTVVGEFADIAVGETLKVTGVYTTHPKYGLQLKAEQYERLMPATAAAIASYLSSGAIKGIGPAIARKLVERFGDDTLTVIEQNPARLAEIGGISPKKAESISKEYQKLFGIRTVMLFLSNFGVPASFAIKTWKKLGMDAQEIVSKNPYILCSEEIGVAFETADVIAARGGVAPDSLERIGAGVMHVLRHNTGNGHTCLPQEKLVEVSCRLTQVDSYHIIDGVDELVARGELVRLGVNGEDFIYIPRYYEAECYIASKLSLMLQNTGEGLLPDVDGFVAEHERRQGIVYAELQRRAITTAITRPMMILTGGPGTGKTTAIAAIIHLLGQMGEKVALAAPTGRAAKRMSELTGVEAKTVHRLLEVDYSDGSGALRFKRNEKNPLPCDAVIIDETSMMDTLLFESLLRALKFSCRLILVGDPDQLPSVGAGNTLGDLIESGVVPVVHLREIFRQAAKSLIVTNAHAIVTGAYPRMDQKDNDFFLLTCESSAQILTVTADLCRRRLPKSYGYSPMWDIQVIAPTRVGAAGTGELNRVLQTALNPPDPAKKEFAAGTVTFREGDKVMQIKNNYDLVWEKDGGEQGMGIFNGDIGVIELINRPSSSMIIRFEDRNVEYSFDMANELELAYAITVHKSQGNEYDAVIMPLMDGRSRMYYRNLLYTAVTRAKKLLIIVGSERAVRMMVDNHKKSRRYTNLVYLLGEVCDGEVQ